MSVPQVLLIPTPPQENHEHGSITRNRSQTRKGISSLIQKKTRAIIIIDMLDSITKREMEGVCGVVCVYRL